MPPNSVGGVQSTVGTGETSSPNALASPPKFSGHIVANDFYK